MDFQERVDIILSDRTEVRFNLSVDRDQNCDSGMARMWASRTV